MENVLVRSSVVLVMVTLAACGYNAHFEDCAIRCPSDVCPTGLACGPQGFCVSTTAATCRPTLDAASSNIPFTDGDLPNDTIPTDATTAVTLDEATSDVPTGGSSVYCNNGGTQTVRGNAWYRAFRLSDFGIVGPFQVTRVDFAAAEAKGATVTVTVSIYSGPVGGPTLDKTMMTSPVTTPEPVADSESQQAGLSAPIAATIPMGGTFVVELSATDTFTAGGATKLTYFHIGANTAGERASGYMNYFESAACGVALQSQSRDFIISVEGTY